MNKKIIAMFSIVLVSFLWSHTFVFTKDLLAKLGPNTILVLRFLISFIVLFIIRKLLKIHESIKKEDRIKFIMIALLLPAHYILSNIASITLDATESIFFSSLQALITLVCASFILNEEIRPIRSNCVAVASIGAVLTMNIAVINGPVISGYIFMFIAVIAWVLYCIYLYRSFREYRISTIVYYQSLISFITLLPISLFENNNFSALSSQDIIYLLYLGVVCISLCLIFNIYALRDVGPIVVGMLMNMSPIFFLITNSILTNTLILGSHFIGSILITLGTLFIFYLELKETGI